MDKFGNYGQIWRNMENIKTSSAKPGILSVLIAFRSVLITKLTIGGDWIIGPQGHPGYVFVLASPGGFCFLGPATGKKQHLDCYLLDGALKLNTFINTFSL